MVVDRPVIQCDVFPTLDQRAGTLEDVAEDETDFRGRMFAAQDAGDTDGAERELQNEFVRKAARTTRKNVEQVRDDLFTLWSDANDL